MRKTLVALMLASICLLYACAGPAPAATDEPVRAGSPRASAPTPLPASTPGNNNLIELTVLGISQVGTRTSENDLLTPIWRAKTGISASIVSIPEYTDYTDYLQNAASRHSLPDVFALDEGIFNVPERYQFLKEKSLLMEIPLDAVKQYMPLTAQRLNQMGISIEEWYYANLEPEETDWLCIPQLPSPLFDESIRQTRYGIDQTPLNLSYVWVRDDILTQIVPSARSQEAFEIQYNIHGEDLDINAILDWGVSDLDDFSTLLEGMKAYFESQTLDLISAHPLYNASAGSVVWSLFSASGYCWNDMPEFRMNPAGSTADLQFFALTSGWKKYVAWLNRCYSGGLFGSDYFSISESTRTGRLQRGAYTVINWWLPTYNGISPINSIQYGWRLYPVFLDSAVQNADEITAISLSLDTDGAVGFNSQALDRSLLPVLLSWVDWNYSLEAQELRTWGVDMSEGEGADRRFKQQYEGVEKYMLSQQSSDGHDGWYYGLINTLSNSYEYWNHEVYGIGGSDPGQGSPFYTYPLRSIPFNQLYYVPYMLKKHLITQKLDMRYIIVDTSSENKLIGEGLKNLYASFKSAYASELTDDMNKALLNAVTGSESAFESNYQIYLNLYQNSAAMQIQNQILQYIAENMAD